MTLFFFAVVVVVTAAFAFLNGFRDASTSVALAVRTRALTPTVAVLLAALFNFVGASLSAALALQVSRSWISLPDGENGLTILVAGLLSAVLWGIYTWWRGIPSSSTHALVGGLAGAGLASVLVGGNYVGGVNNSLLFQVALPLLLSPVLAFAGAYLLVWPATWAARYTPPNVVNSRSRRTQAIAAGAVAFGHGLQDGQRTSAVLLLALLASGLSDGAAMPAWVALLTATMLTAGTLAGGWRISYTNGYKLTPDRSAARLRGAAVQLSDPAPGRDRAALARVYHAHGHGGRARRRQQPGLPGDQPQAGAKDPGLLALHSGGHGGGGLRAGTVTFAPPGPLKHHRLLRRRRFEVPKRRLRSNRWRKSLIRSGRRRSLPWPSAWGC